MSFSLLPRVLAPFLLALLLFVGACGKAKEPSRWDKAQQESTQKKPVKKTADQNSNLPNKPVAGGKFNKMFPPAGNGYQVVFSQEKAGFAEAKLKKGGKDVAMLSINDIASNPSAAAKFQQSTKKIGGYPAVTQGSTGTAVLVNNRYQVKVQSRDPSFGAEDREEWLGKFNLAGLAKVK
jgi:hypothetical protein